MTTTTPKTPLPPEVQHSGAANQQAAGGTAGTTTPAGRMLVELEHIGKDYPVINGNTSRLRTILSLLAAKPVHDYYRALEGITLSIRKGESWGLIGANGAGKSTLMKIIAGVVNPSVGSKQVHGRIGALLELGTGFHPDYTGRENIYLAGALMGWTRADLRERETAILAFADIGSHIDQPVKTYSSGMVVRLGFALATTLQPDLLVTDEVLAVGDESFQRKCLRWIENYLGGGGSLLLCSHSMYHVQSLCQNALWLDKGRERMRGEVFAVTQAYLADHEERSRKQEQEERQVISLAPYPVLESIMLCTPRGEPVDSVAMGDNLMLRGTYHSPDDEPTVLMVGIVRADGTPVYGTFSNDAGYRSARISEQRFSFSCLLKNLRLLPGKYSFKAHTLDVHGLRLFDTRETAFTVTGQTRDHGLVRIDLEWRND